MGDDQVPDQDVFAVFTNTTDEGRKVRPSNWPTRLADIAAAHWRSREGQPRCGPCYHCSNRYCFAIEQHLLEAEKGLAEDLLFFVKLIGAQQVTSDCPKFNLACGGNQDENSNPDDLHPQAA
ncbi:MAG: hypothetical protein P8180_10015 [Gammaproteobacteria bacterium]|jgi:hypothetical protein